MISGIGMAGFELSYLFVDGGSLDSVVKRISDRWFNGADVPLDYGALKEGHRKAFYYDAWIAEKKPTQTEQDFEAERIVVLAKRERIADTDGFHVYEGDARYKRKQGLVQKKVDVMIAVDMLSHAFRGNMQKATLFTGDSDFKPLLDALVQHGMYVTLWHPPQAKAELKQAADARHSFGLQQLWNMTAAEFKAQHRIPTAQIGEPRMSDIVHIGNYNSVEGGLWHAYQDMRAVGAPFFLRPNFSGGQTLKIYGDTPERMRMFAFDVFGETLPEDAGEA